jgi:hypothetical protein
MIGLLKKLIEKKRQTATNIIRTKTKIIFTNIPNLNLGFFFASKVE